jgi:hypothetical protein
VAIQKSAFRACRKKRCGLLNRHIRRDYFAGHAPDLRHRRPASPARIRRGRRKQLLGLLLEISRWWIVA